MPTNLKGKKSINTSILNLVTSKPLIVPSAHGDPIGLLNLLPQHLPSQSLQPSIPQLPRTKSIRCENRKINRIGHVQPVVNEELLHVAADTYADECVAAISEEGVEGLGNVLGVEELVDQAIGAHAELQRGHWVFDRTVEVGAPLHVKPYDSGLEVGLGEP